MYGTEPSAVHGGDHGDFVAALAAFLKPVTYLELGAAKLETFNKVAPNCTHAIGVDHNRFALDGDAVLASGGITNTDITTKRRRSVVVSDTLAFLKLCESASVDFIFLDSSHEYEQTLLELEEIARVLAPNGILVMHDTYPPNEEQCEPGRCGEAWSTVNCLELRYRFERVTLPAQYGLTIMRKSLGRQLLWK